MGTIAARPGGGGKEKMGYVWIGLQAMVGCDVGSQGEGEAQGWVRVRYAACCMGAGVCGTKKLVVGSRRYKAA